MDADLDTTSFKSKTGPMVLVVSLLVALAAIGLGYLVLTREKPPNPIRVVVVLRGEVDPSFDAELVDNFVDGLADFGFVPQQLQPSTPLPPGGDIVPSLRQMALEADAAHALFLDLAVELERDSFTNGTGLYRADLSVQLIPTDPDGTTPSESMEFTFERESPLQIATMVRNTWIELLLPAVIDWLYASPSLGPALAGDLSVEDLASSRNLRERRDAVEIRRERVAEFEGFCATERDLLDVQESLSDYQVQCAGDPCGQWTVVGIDHDGSHAFVQDISRRALFPIPWERARWAEPPEALLSLPLTEDPTPRPILRTGNILGFAELTTDGSLASLAAFSANESLAIVTLDVETAEWRQLTLLEPGQRAVRTIPSPDGSSVLVRMRRPRTHADPNEPVWYLERESERFAHPWYSQPTWLALPNGALAVAGLLPDGQIGFASPEGALQEPSTALPGELQRILSAQNGLLWLLWLNDLGECVLGSIDLETHLASQSAVLPICVAWPRLLPDGRIVGTAEASSPGDSPGDIEVVIIDPELSTVTPLTAGPFDEELPYVSEDGSRIVFNRRLEPWPRDYNLEIYRRLVCWVDVPPRD